jgi:hypothetical protein
VEAKVRSYGGSGAGGAGDGVRRKREEKGRAEDGAVGVGLRETRLSGGGGGGWGRGCGGRRRDGAGFQGVSAPAGGPSGGAGSCLDQPFFQARVLGHCHLGRGRGCALRGGVEVKAQTQDRAGGPEGWRPRVRGGAGPGLGRGQGRGSQGGAARADRTTGGRTD